MDTVYTLVLKNAMMNNEGKYTMKCGENLETSALLSVSGNETLNCIYFI